MQIFILSELMMRSTRSVKVKLSPTYDSPLEY